MSHTLKVRFLAEKDAVSKIIEFVTGGSLFCHCEFEVDTQTQADLGITKPYVGAHDTHGVNAYDDSFYVGGNTITRLYVYEFTLTDQQYAAFIAFVKPRLGEKYDFSDIFGILLEQDWHNENKAICSAFLTAALVSMGIRILNVLPSYTYKVTPETAHLSSFWIGKRVFAQEAPKAA